MSLLKVSNLSIQFGGLRAVEKLSFEVLQGSITAIIGPNGAGKTTAFNAISGLCKPTEGSITISGLQAEATLSNKLVWNWAFFGLIAGTIAAFAYNLEALWQLAIVDRYKIGTDYSWLEGFGTASNFIANNFIFNFAVPFFLVSVIVIYMQFVQWSRNRVSPEHMSKLGVARTFQNIRLFQHMSALNNVKVALDPRTSCGLLSALFVGIKCRRAEKASNERAAELLELVELADRAQDKASSLPYGLQRRLEIARALASSPKILLLDEPAAGLNPVESLKLIALIRKINSLGVTVILIEHDMKVVMPLANEVIVLEYGKKIASGTPSEIQQNERVIAAYLGSE